jgi:cytochrome c oxidase cbb3-type subunit III
MPTKIEKDTISGQDTTGHEWDGIKELNTPLPKWWLYVFIACIVWALGYWVFYPSLPGLHGHLNGVLGYTQRNEIRRQLAEADKQKAPYVDKIRAASLDEIRQNPELSGFAVAGGRSAFANNCAPCHGAGAQGAAGYPNLVDDVWLWGGTLDQIHTTIAYGIRNANPNTRQSLMPRFGADNLLTPVQINDVAEHVLNLTGRATDPAAAQRGAAVFTDQCVACHGAAGQGNIELGAPPLNGRVWLYGGDKANIVQTVTFARNGNMPAWSERLDEATIKMLAVYVHQLGGGK